MFLENKKDLYENNEVDPIEIYKYLPKLIYCASSKFFPNKVN